MGDRGRGRGRDPHDRDGAGRGRGRGMSNERPPYREYNPPEWDDRFDSRDDYRKRAGGGSHDDFREWRERRESLHPPPPALPLPPLPPPPQSYRGDREFIPPSSRHDRPPAHPRPPSREGSRDSISRSGPPKAREQPNAPVPSPRERGMIDKPLPMSRPVGPPVQSATSITQSFTKEGQVQSPARRTSTISNQNEPSLMNWSFTHSSPKHQQETANPAAMGDSVQSWLQAMMQQQQQAEGEQYVLAELIQKTSYTHYRHLTCYAEYKAAKQETAKHSTHFPQFPALRERYTGAEKAKETAYIEAKNAASEAASKLNLFLQSLTSAVVLKKNDSEVATEAVRNSKEALKAAEESKRSLENLDTRFKRFVGRESIKPAAPDNETVQRLQDEVKQLKEGKAEMEKGFREYRTETETYMKGYQEKLERFMEAQAALRGDIGKIQEEREADKGEMKKEFKELLEEKMKKKEESVMVIDVEDETKLNARVVGVMSSLEERVVALEKALGQMQTMSSESKVNTNVSNSPPAAPPPWVPQDFPTQWDALLAETASIQSKLTLCDEAVEKANLAMTSSHDAIAEEFGRLQDNIDKLTLQTNETSHSLKAVSKSTDSTVEKLRTDTTYLINMHFPEMKTRIQQELQTALSTRFGNIDIRLANIEKHCTSQAQMLEGLNRFVEPLTEKINHLQPLGDKVNLLENAREAMEVAIQGMNNQMTNFQFKEITEKVAGMIGMQRVANVEKELNGIKGQVNALIAVSQKGQKAQAQQAQQVQGGQGKQVQQQPGPLKNGTEGMMVTNGAGSTSSMSPSVRAAVLARALETIQQEQQQQLSPTLYNSGNPAATPLNAVTSRLASLEDNLKHINSIVQPLAANTLNIQSLPPRLANLEKRLETQDAKLAIFSSNPPGFGKILTLENQMRNFEANVQNLMSTSSAEIRKLHENIAAVEQKLASSAAAVAAVNGESNSDATMNDGNENGGLPEGFLKEYAPGNLAALTEDLNDLRKQFELKVDYNLKQWAGKVKDNIQKIIKDVKELNTRFEEVVAAAAAGGGSGPGGGSLRDGGAGGVGLMSLEGVRQGSMGRGGSRGGSGGGSGGGSRGGSIDSEPTGGGALGGR